MSTYRHWSILCFFIVSAPTSAHAETKENRISWQACEGERPPGLRDRSNVRVSCASLAVPRHYGESRSPMTDIQVMRIRTGPDTERRQAISFNFGGPGLDPRPTLERLASNWTGTSPDDGIGGDFRKAAERFDLITVVPRGVDRQNRFVCNFRQDPPLADLYRNRDSNKTWRELFAISRDYANDCAHASIDRGIDTRTHVRDIEEFRVAAGYEKLSFYGCSYGTLVALWYASVFSDRTGRLVLDGVMDVTRSWGEQFKTGLVPRDEALFDVAVQPAADQPQDYRLGSRPGHILALLMRMPLPLRMAWQAAIRHPADVLAAVTVSHWLTSGVGPQQIQSQLKTHRFSPEGDTNTMAAQAASRLYQLASRRGHPEVFSYDPPTLASAVNIAVQCNDSKWDGNIDTWRQFILNAFGWSFSLGEGGIFTSLACAQWPANRALSPDISPLVARKALLIHGEYDRVTPWVGAQATLARMPDARAVLARGATDHGLLNKTRSACIERNAAHYLLTGNLPAKRVTQCNLSAGRVTIPSSAAGLSQPMR